MSRNETGRLSVAAAGADGVRFTVEMLAGLVKTRYSIRSEMPRVSAFFVHPAWARRGIGRSIMAACERAIVEARFRTVDIVATLAGEPLYASFGYAVVERYEIPLAGGLSLPAVRMTKRLARE